MRTGSVVMAGRVWRVAQAPDRPALYDDGWRLRPVPEGAAPLITWDDDEARVERTPLRLVRC